MKVVIQRVNRATVFVDNTVVGKIGSGILCFVGIHVDDTKADAEYCTRKILRCKLWDGIDNNGLQKSWHQSVMDKDYEILVVSQFTLMGRLQRSNNPDFHYAMCSNEARELFDTVIELLKQHHGHNKIQMGKFGSKMKVEIENDGPVTILLDSSELKMKK